MKVSLIAVVLALCGLIPTSFASAHLEDSKKDLSDGQSHRDRIPFDIQRVLLEPVETRSSSGKGDRKGNPKKRGKKGNYEEGDHEGGLEKGGKKGRASVGKKGRSADSRNESSQTPPSAFPSTAPNGQPILEVSPSLVSTESPASYNKTAHPTPVTFPPSLECAVVATCIPPIDPADPQGGRFEDCNSINIDPAECTDTPTLLTFRFNGGDCLDSNNAYDPNFFSCEDFFDGPPPSDSLGAEVYMIITDNEGFKYFDGSIKVGDYFNITNFSPFHAAVNVTVYDGTPAPENIRETMIISTTCSEATFLKDRFGVLQLEGFSSATQGYQQCIISVSYDFTVTSSYQDFVVSLESMMAIQNLDPQNELLNFTDDVLGVKLNAGDEFVLSSGPINVDLCIRKQYSMSVEVSGTAPSGFSCRAAAFDTMNFTTGVLDTRP